MFIALSGLCMSICLDTVNSAKVQGFLSVNQFINFPQGYTFPSFQRYVAFFSVLHRVHYFGGCVHVYFAFSCAPSVFFPPSHPHPLPPSPCFFFRHLEKQILFRLKLVHVLGFVVLCDTKKRRKESFQAPN